MEWIMKGEREDQATYRGAKCRFGAQWDRHWVRGSSLRSRAQPDGRRLERRECR